MNAEETRRIARQEATSVVRQVFTAFGEKWERSTAVKQDIAEALATLDAPQGTETCNSTNPLGDPDKPCTLPLGHEGHHGTPSPALPELPPGPSVSPIADPWAWRSYTDALRSTAEQYRAEIERLRKAWSDEALRADREKQRADAAEADASEMAERLIAAADAEVAARRALEACEAERDRLAARIAEAEGQFPAAWIRQATDNERSNGEGTGYNAVHPWAVLAKSHRENGQPLYARPIPADSIPRAEHEAALREARAKERERCAQTAENCFVGWPYSGKEQRSVCGRAIRALEDEA